MLRRAIDIVSRDSRGEALILVLLVAFAILALGIAGSRAARIEMQISRHDVMAKQALALAEGGLNHAFTLLAGAGSFDDELDGDDDAVHDGTGGVLGGIGSIVAHDGVDHRFRALGAGGYFVKVDDNWDETTGTDDPSRDTDSSVRIVSVGVVANAVRQVEGLVSLDNSPDCAITVNGDILVSGDAQISGSSGCLHSNEDITNISGNPTMEAGASASGNFEIGGSPTMESPWGYLSSNTQKNNYETAHEGVAAKTIPKVCPLQYGPTAMNLANLVRARGGYLLSQDGKVYNSSMDWLCSPGNAGSNPCMINSGHIASGTWNGWKWGSDSGVTPGAKWEYERTGSTAFDGVFFVEGHVIIPADAGASSNPWDATIIAMNSISVSGNPWMRPFETTGDLRNVLFVSGNDLGLSGNLGASGRPAASFTHQQIKLNGNTVYTGYFMAEDGATTCSPNIAPTKATKESYEDGYNTASGNPQINFDGNVDTALFQGSLRLVSWNEVRAP